MSLSQNITKLATAIGAKIKDLTAKTTANTTEIRTLNNSVADLQKGVDLTSITARITALESKMSIAESNISGVTTRVTNVESKASTNATRVTNAETKLANVPTLTFTTTDPGAGATANKGDVIVVYS
ncbi:MAG: hypothetical protein NC080_07440 [Paraprevotella sp.]|nr:hypothetical protein [Paraprevotella sp.]